MSIEQRGHMPLDYDPVCYPGSVLRFRGPRLVPDDPPVVCIGGAETYGRFIPAPFPTHLARLLPGPVLNLGVMNAGLDVITQDPVIRNAMARARAVVLQVPSAQNMSNRFYSVHPRRNDRFLKASQILRTIYREVDFTEFHFTRHLLTHLKSLSGDRFAIIRAELEQAWVGRMIGLLNQLTAPVHLLWLSNRPLNEEGGGLIGLGPDPLFVTPKMIDAVRPHVASVTVAVPGGQDHRRPQAGMSFGPRELPAARLLPGPEAHERAAADLARLLR